MSILFPAIQHFLTGILGGFILCVLLATRDQHDHLSSPHRAGELSHVSGSAKANATQTRQVTIAGEGYGGASPTDTVKVTRLTDKAMPGHDDEEFITYEGRPSPKVQRGDRETFRGFATVLPSCLSKFATTAEDNTGEPASIFNEINLGYDTPPPSPTLKPVQSVSLRDRLVGAWQLESYIAYPTKSSPIQRPTYPMTKNVTGLIMYTPDGFMSAQMIIPGQQPFSKGQRSDEAQWAEAGKRCFAYCGPYYVSRDGPDREERLRHKFQFCSLPGWAGDVQVRTWEFREDGDVLVLGSEEPTEVKGDYRIPVLTWRKCRSNVDGVPPPPVPKIKISGPGEA